MAAATAIRTACCSCLQKARSVLLRLRRAENPAPRASRATSAMDAARLGLSRKVRKQTLVSQNTLSLQILVKRLKLALPQRCCQPWGHISQSFESKFSSNSVWFAGRRELCRPGKSQSVGRGWVSFSTPVMARRYSVSHRSRCDVGSHGMADSGYSNGWGS